MFKNVSANEKPACLPSIFCEECDFTTESKLIVNEHIESYHSSDFWLVGSKKRKQNNDIESSNKKSEEKEEVSLSKRRNEIILEKKKVRR